MGQWWGDFFFPWLDCFRGYGTHHWDFEITLIRTTLSRIPLDEWTPVAETSDNARYLLGTEIHDPGGIRTRNPSRRAAADSCLRPHSHCQPSRTEPKRFGLENKPTFWNGGIYTARRTEPDRPRPSVFPWLMFVFTRQPRPILLRNRSNFLGLKCVFTQKRLLLLNKRLLHQILPINPLKPELNPICNLLALLGAHYFFHVSRIRVKLLTFRLLMSYIYGAPILDVSRSHTTTHHSR